MTKSNALLPSELTLLIAELRHRIDYLERSVLELKQENEALRRENEELKARLNLNSRNSSQPPSSDGWNRRQPKSLREKGLHPRGGQPGHEGKTLERAEEPDRVQFHGAARCDACGAELDEGEVIQSRQVIDVAPIRKEVVEHRVRQTRCACGKVHVGQFPSEVNASVQYGPVVKAIAVHLNQGQLIPVARTAQCIEDLLGLPVSQTFVMQACTQAKERLEPVVDEIGRAVQAAPVVHADETGLRVNQRLNWLHTACTTTLTWLGLHEKRGQEAFQAQDILPAFKGVLVHDGWKPYQALDCTHALCNAHHLRELTYVQEQMHQPWAGDMIALLTQANRTVQANPCGISPEQIGHWQAVYDLILEQATLENPRAAPTGKRGKTKQTKATNLIARLREFADDVWRFATDPSVPFTNNLAEQAVRMTKVKQKISGGFRTQDGADTFCTIRSYLATLRKQGANLFHALVNTFNGYPSHPQWA